MYSEDRRTPPKYIWEYLEEIERELKELNKNLKKKEPTNKKKKED